MHQINTSIKLRCYIIAYACGNISNHSLNTTKPKTHINNQPLKPQATQHKLSHTHTLTNINYITPSKVQNAQTSKL